jgi:hypothetical protein
VAGGVRKLPGYGVDHVDIRSRHGRTVAGLWMRI